jgi:hypothetical protein
VVLAASMLGLFTIEMPGFIQTRLSNTSNQQQAGTYLGVGSWARCHHSSSRLCGSAAHCRADRDQPDGDVVRGGAPCS